MKIDWLLGRIDVAVVLGLHVLGLFLSKSTGVDIANLVKRRVTNTV